MKAYLATRGLTALIAGVIAVGSAAARADDAGDENREKVEISTTSAPAAIGPYSQAIRVGRTVYVSGTREKHGFRRCHIADPGVSRVLTR